MPELPEVETIRRQLAEVLVGQRVVGVEVKSIKSFFGMAEQIINKKIVEVSRRAKILVIGFEGGWWILVHLKMTGQLIYQATELSSYQVSKSTKFGDHKPHFELGGRIVGGPARKRYALRIAGGHPTADWVASLPNSHTRVVIYLSNEPSFAKVSEGNALYFNDQRMFGWMKLVGGDEIEREFKNYGPDITDPKVDEKYFWKIIQKSRRAIKVVTMDQKDVAGVGNIYANDALWCAKINPTRKAKDLKRLEANTLLKCLKEVINEGIKYGGATASDDKFVQTSGLGGKYQEYFKTYERSFQHCLRNDGGKIQKITLGGRGTYFCPICQK